MSVTRRRFHELLLGGLGATLLLPFQGSAAWVEGRDWRPLEPPQATAVPGLIEVLEFFSYGCPHCGQLNPLIKTWAEGLPGDVLFRRVPVTFGRASLRHLARLYFALEQTGDLARLDQPIFDAIAREREPLFTEKAIFGWVEAHGVALDAFKAAFNGDVTETRIAQGDQLEQRYQVDAVPMITVAGRYVVVGKTAKGYADLLTIANGLIEWARQGITQG